MKLSSRSFSAVVLAAALVSAVGCKERDFNGEEGSDTEAYGATGTHIVVAAPFKSGVQGLWVCDGNKVGAGTDSNGYLVSIGLGSGKFTNTGIWTPEVRNTNGSNLTPVGKLRIRKKTESSCGAGMEAKCLYLEGLEPGINNNTSGRMIAIHATPTGNYDDLGESASHGCIRTTHKDVKLIASKVKVGTLVYINSVNVPKGKNPCAFVGDKDGKARAD